MYNDGMLVASISKKSDITVQAKNQAEAWLVEGGQEYSDIISALNTPESIAKLTALAKGKFESKDSFLKKAYQKINLKK
jgi:hypothetical protein